MKHRSLLIGLLWLMGFVHTASAQVEVRNNSYYINGRKFFVKGIGYEGILPGQSQRTYNPDLLRFDMQRILSGGFNTIRTWGAFTKQELEVLKEYDIKIIMGIWINPEGNFANQQFVKSAKSTVAGVLNYSKNHDNIIGYLIMNEPAPSVVLRDYKSTVSLWKELSDIIHTQHPGRPVSIANTPNGTYVDAALFDFSAYNVYIYNPVTVNYLHGYRGHVDYLRQLNTSGGPLIITEYGLPVSPSGPGQWGYGGNSLAEQRSGNLYMYKSLVDGGANGACVFNYTDGWWKAGNEYSHDDSPEEWYGLTEYTGLSDTRGKERPVWKAMHDYQSAIIAQPRSEEIYVNEVPVEVFFNDTIRRMEVLMGGEVIYQHAVAGEYLADILPLTFSEMKDAKLVFNCYDVANNLIKSEEKSILMATAEPTLPGIEITVNDDCWDTGRATVVYNITRAGELTVPATLEYVYYPHVGFDYGQKFKANITGQNQVTKTHTIAGNVDVFTVGAALDITYKGFKKRVFNQLTLSRRDLSAAGIEQGVSADSYPAIRITGDPKNGFLTLVSDGGLQFARIEVIDINGQIIAVYSPGDSNFNLPVGELAKGTCLLRVYDEEGRSATCKVSL